MLRTLVVDDEPHAVQSIRILLEENCPNVSIVGLYTNSTEALKFIQNNGFDLLLLDIDMPFLNGFELLNKIENVNFKVIFVSAYDQYAIKAFRFSAFDYLLKPVDESDLKNAIDKLEKLNNTLPQASHYQYLFDLFNKNNQPAKKITLPTLEGFEFVEIADIIRCESDSNYTKVFIQNTPTKLISRTLKEVEETLSNLNFMRVHNSHIINKNHVKKYVKSDGGYILMSDNAQIPISRTRKDEVIFQLTR
jgi:two-component system, LytTR family, response regulator